MIITTNDIRLIRPIAENIQLNRMLIYIEEAEGLYVRPAIGAEVYKGVIDTPELHETLLEGGFYDDNKKYFEGLKKATSYLAYGRMLLNHDFNVTAFGTVFKNGELSEQTEEKTLIRISNDAINTGVRYLNECVDYLRFIGLLNCCVKPANNCRIKIIGE